MLQKCSPTCCPAGRGEGHNLETCSRGDLGVKFWAPDAKMDQTWPTVGQWWPNSGQCWPKSAKIGRSWPKSALVGPKLVDPWPSLVEFAVRRPRNHSPKCPASTFRAFVQDSVSGQTEYLGTPGGPAPVGAPQEGGRPNGLEVRRGGVREIWPKSASQTTEFGHDIVPAAPMFVQIRA